MMKGIIFSVQDFYRTYASKSIVIAGSIIGLDYNTLIVGLVGGLFALTWLPSMSITVRISSVMIAAVLAGYLSPLLASVLIPSSAKVSFSGVQYFMALCIGYSAYGILLPNFRKFLNRLISKKIDEVKK